MDLDPERWGTMPQDLRERVFAWLPPDCFCRFRCVHKQWDEMLLSQNFLNAYSRACETQEPWVILALCRPFENPQPQCWLYNPSLEKWYLLSFSFLPSTGAEVLATDGGLVCCQTESGIYICNPLTGCWTELFPMYVFNLYSDSVALSVNCETKAYKVILVGLQVENDTHEVHIFDSTTQTWERGGKAPYGYKVTDLVIVHGNLFCVTINWDVVSYNLEQKEWSRIQVPEDVRPCLMEYNGSLLIGNAFISDDGVFANVVVFEVELEHTQVRQLAIMPEEFLQELNNCNGDNYGVEFLEGNTICVRLDRDNQQLLMYTAPTRSWKWLPQCPAEGFSDVVEPCYHFKPRLDALI